MSSTTEATLWICESCGFIYDPAVGDPDGGIPPGTSFEDIPGDWFCPVCGARTSDFRPLEPGEASESPDKLDWLMSQYDYDRVVIGAGFGASVSALRRAEN